MRVWVKGGISGRWKGGWVVRKAPRMRLPADRQKGGLCLLEGRRRPLSAPNPQLLAWVSTQPWCSEVCCRSQGSPQNPVAFHPSRPF